jgi:hypothetical protein
LATSNVVVSGLLAHDDDSSVPLILTDLLDARVPCVVTAAPLADDRTLLLRSTLENCTA